MKNFIRTKLIAFSMAVSMMIGFFTPITTFAAETEYTKDVDVKVDNSVTRAGVETLPYGWYDIGAFTFTDCNYTPVKTVQGSVVSFSFLFKKASIDAGLGPVKLTVQICDENCNPISPKWVYSLNSENDIQGIMTPDFNLGYTGRKIRIFTDASSVGASNGNYRSIDVLSFSSYVK